MTRFFIVCIIFETVMMRKISLFVAIFSVAFVANAQSSDSLGLFKQYDSLMNQYKSAKSNYDAKKEKLESIKTAAVDISTLSVSGATEKSKAMAAAKLEKEKAALELSARKKAVVEIAEKANTVYQNKLNNVNSIVQNAAVEVGSKEKTIKTLKSKEAKAKGKAKAAITKEINVEKSNLDNLVKKQIEAKKSFDEADANAKKSAENLKTASSLVVE